jgi:hypothetical protein
MMQSYRPLLSDISTIEETVCAFYQSGVSIEQRENVHLK